MLKIHIFTFISRKNVKNQSKKLFFVIENVNLLKTLQNLTNGTANDDG